jgi:ABC-type amino acid transport substrate-binding protein
MRLLPFVALLILLHAGCNDAGRSDRFDSWQSVQDRGEGRIAVIYVPADGFAYVDAEGGLTGVTVDMMRRFADWLLDQGYEVEVDFKREDDWQRFYSRVRDGHAGMFGIGNVTITDERRSEIAFSPPYMTNTAVLISPDFVPELVDWADLRESFAGLNALAFEGTLHEERLRRLIREHHPDAEIAYAHSNSEIIERVAAGEYFAYVDGYNVWRAQQDGAAIRHHTIGDDASEAFGVIMPLESDWDAPMERFMNQFIGSSSHRSIFERHLGERLAASIIEQ